MFFHLSKGLAALLFLLPLLGSAKTLLVTHPELSWDNKKSTAKTTSALLKNPEFSRKIVLTTGARFTFPKAGLRFEKIYSGQGEFLLKDPLEKEFVIAGGFFEACSQISVINILQMQNENLILHFNQEAIFTLPVGAENAVSLADFRKQIGDEAFKEELRKYSCNVFRQLKESFAATDYKSGKQLHGAKAEGEVEIQLFFQNELISTLGSGGQKVELRF